ncbi:MAG: hypothetical protein JSR75_19665 [Proteobacteria bacterium]|nr:hypothetical protein [Pseudomonadota bacterium]
MRVALLLVEAHPRGQCSVHIEIKMILYRYRIARANDGRLFAYGYDRATADVRIIELQDFDAATLTGSAKNDTAVELDGAPALDLNAGWWWAQYCAQEGLGQCTDVTP